MSWQEHLRMQGFAHFPGLTPEPLVKAARDAIEADLSSNYDSARQSESNRWHYLTNIWDGWKF